MIEWSVYGTIGLANKVNQRQCCPLGRSTFLSRESMIKQCKAYRKYGYYIAGSNVSSGRCEICTIPESKSEVPPNVTIR